MRMMIVTIIVFISGNVSDIPSTAEEIEIGPKAKLGAALTRIVVITGVDPSGAAASAGLREGDVIQQINGSAVRSGEDVRTALNAATDRPSVLLVARGSATIFVPLRAR